MDLQEQFQHAPNSLVRVGGTSSGLNGQQGHSHGLHPCAHPCCHQTGTTKWWIVVCGVQAAVFEVLEQALLFPTGVSF